MSGETIRIKKYGNRRLYDTHQSRYVNLDEVAAMIRGGAAVEVVDAKSGEDLTRLILTQIILEDAKKQRGGLPEDFLRQMVMASDRAMQGFLANWLHTATDAFRRTQQAMSGRSSDTGGRPLSPMDLWNPVRMMELFVDAARRSPGMEADPPPSAAEAAAPIEPTPDDEAGQPPASPADEVAALRARLEALEEKLSAR